MPDGVQKLSLKLEGVVIGIVLNVLEILTWSNLYIIELRKGSQEEIIDTIDAGEISLVSIEGIEHAKRLQCFIQVDKRPMETFTQMSRLGRYVCTLGWTEKSQNWATIF